MLPGSFVHTVRCVLLASITAFQTADKNKTPLIGYFYDPQWLQNEIKLVQIHLPPYTPGCDADLKKVACDYPPYTLNKVVRTEWLNSGGAAATFIKNAAKRGAIG